MAHSLSKSGRQRCRAAARQRGSLTVLVVVALALVAVLGAAYIQVARLDRIATKQMATGNIDTVKMAVINYIGDVLAADLLDDNGRFLNPAEDEPYDYPGTNGAATFTVQGITGLSGNAAGGTLDDTWLASAEPRDYAGTPNWPHITNLYGLFIDDYAGGSDLSLVPPNVVPREQIVTNTGGVGETDDTAVALNDPTLATPWLLIDADGDGIGDSRWTWATIKQITGIVYVMAVRIVDNSGMVNANVALSQVSAADTFDISPAGDQAPRWCYPTELDLGNFVFITDATAGAELQQLLTYRLGAAPASPVPWFVDSTTPEARLWFWARGARLYRNFNDAVLTGPATSYVSFDIADELELRHRNGRNNDQTDSNLEDQMPNFLRRDTAEAALVNPSYAQIQAYFENETRHQQTVLSGANIWAPAHGGDAGTVLKVDLNWTLDTAISAAIKSVVDQGTFALPVSVTSTQEYADQFAANIRDYFDEDDNLLTEVNGRYGLEALPFLTEVYAQRDYMITGPSIDNGNDTWDVTWTQQGDVGYAIEIANPFPHPIDLTNVHLWVGGTDWGELDAIAGAALAAVNGGTDQTLHEDQILILYRNSSGGGNDDVTALFNAAPAPVTVDMAVAAPAALWPDGFPPPWTPPFPVAVELRAMVPPVAPAVLPTQLPWAYSRINSHQSKLVFSQAGYAPLSVINGGVDPSTLNIHGYQQFERIGNGNRLNMMTVTPLQVFNPPDNEPDVPYTVGLDALGEADKTAAGGPPGAVNLVANPQQVIIRNQAPYNDQIGRALVGELAHIAVIGPTPTATFADVWAGATDVADFMLDFSLAAARVDPAVDHLNVPHAVFLIDRLTTMAPDVDGEDNDGDRILPDPPDDPDELLVPGLININTATEHLLAKILPIPDPVLRAGVAADIVAYRDDPFGLTRTSVSTRIRPGVAHVGELLPLFSTALPATDGLDTATIDDGTGAAVKVDFTANLDATSGDGIVDDREEEMMLGTMLSQVGTTRSDFFTAYVKIEGYKATDFSLGPVESRHFLVVYDRSRVTVDTTTSPPTITPPQVLGIFELN